MARYSRFTVRINRAFFRAADVSIRGGCALALAVVLAVPDAGAQTRGGRRPASETPSPAPSTHDSERMAGAAINESSALGRISRAGAGLVRQVARSVVQVVATVYRANDADAPLVKARSVGSGVIVHSSGYVMTNAHVVTGATSVELVIADDDGRAAISPGRAFDAVDHEPFDWRGAWLSSQTVRHTPRRRDRRVVSGRSTFGASDTP